MTGRHYITIKGETQTINNPILKTKGKITLPPTSISIVSIKTPILQNTNILYELKL